MRPGWRDSRTHLVEGQWGVWQLPPPPPSPAVYIRVFASAVCPSDRYRWWVRRVGTSLVHTLRHSTDLRRCGSQVAAGRPRFPASKQRRGRLTDACTLAPRPLSVCHCPAEVHEHPLLHSRPPYPHSQSKLPPEGAFFRFALSCQSQGTSTPRRRGSIPPHAAVSKRRRRDPSHHLAGEAQIPSTTRSPQ